MPVENQDLSSAPPQNHLVQPPRLSSQEITQLTNSLQLSGVDKLKHLLINGQQIRGFHIVVLQLFVPISPVWFGAFCAGAQQEQDEKEGMTWQNPAWKQKIRIKLAKLAVTPKFGRCLEILLEIFGKRTVGKGGIYPHAHGRGWNGMGFELLYIPNHSGIILSYYPP